MRLSRPVDDAASGARNAIGVPGPAAGACQPKISHSETCAPFCTLFAVKLSCTYR